MPSKTNRTTILKHGTGFQPAIRGRDTLTTAGGSLCMALAAGKNPILLDGKAIKR